MSTAIKVENLSKSYRLGSISTGSLHKDLQSFWARLRGKEDPNRRIGESSQHRANDDLFWALKDVSFEVKQGEVLGILGRNGAGKSTLLKILSRITAPTQGSVKIRGRIASLLEVGTGFHPELTGRENVYLNGAILGMTRREIARKFDEIVDFAEIEQFIDTPVKRYSSGMYVRLAFAVAAHLDSEILVVDEVLAVGDVQFQKKCLGKMGDVGREGRTVLFVSHDMAALHQLCTNGIVMRHGKIARTGAMDLVIGNYLTTDTTSLNPDGLVAGDSIRIDTGEITVSRLHLLNHNNTPTDTFFFNESIRCSIELCVERPVKRIIVDLQLGTSFEKIAYYSSEASLGELDLQPGSYLLDILCENNLLPDTYYLSLGIHQLGEVRTLYLSEQNRSLHILNSTEGKQQAYPFTVKFGHIQQQSSWRRK